MTFKQPFRHNKLNHSQIHTCYIFVKLRSNPQQVTEQAHFTRFKVPFIWDFYYICMICISNNNRLKPV